LLYRRRISTGVLARLPIIKVAGIFREREGITLKYLQGCIRRGRRQWLEGSKELIK
jgi:hypothetical protein